MRHSTCPTATAATWISALRYMSVQLLKSALESPVLFVPFFPQGGASTIFIIHVPEEF